MTSSDDLDLMDVARQRTPEESCDPDCVVGDGLTLTARTGERGALRNLRSIEYGSQILRRRSMSAIDKLKNKLQDLKGKGKQSTGRATGNDRLENKGRTDQKKSSAKDAGEKVKDVFRD